MAQRIRVHGRVKDIEVKQTSDYEGNQHQEAKITFAVNARPKSPNRPSYTVNRPSYSINRPRRPNGIRYNVGEIRAEAKTDNSEAKA